MPSRRIIVAPAAREDLREIWDYLAVQAGPDVADRILADVRNAMDRLADVPGMGHKRRDVKDPRYRFWAVKSYLIAYRSGPKTLQVARVIHGRRDFRRVFG